MSRSRRPFALLALVCAALAAGAGPATAQRPAPLPEKALYHAGPSGRFLMDGEWLFRLDPANVGVAQGFAKQTGRSGWSPVTVPNAWNATDESQESFTGGVGWYRKDFTLPSAAKALDWVTRFESVNYRSRVYLNGRRLAEHTGAYLPFEVRLPRSVLTRTGVNHLVVRVENRRTASDFPPAGLSVTGTPTGGWWNYGGLLREVYLRRVDGIDLSPVVVRPKLPSPTGPATVEVQATVTNLAAKAARVVVRASVGSRRLALGTVTVPARGSTTLSGSTRIARPRLWSLASPSLYDAELTAATVGKGRRKGRVLQRYALRTGIRSIKVVDGAWLLNGHRLDVRGVGLHEDDKRLGFAIDNTIRAREVAEVKELGATLIRSHYPLHPYTQELADAQGILLWSEVPVYALKTSELAKAKVRKLAAEELRANILANQNHPSIAVWSIGNELSAKPGPVQSYYIARAVAAAHELDPTRPVGLAVAGYPSAGCQPEYGPLDVIGLNDYFGWYPGPNGQIADREGLGAYLDTLHACYPRKAVLVSEFGAEANRSGPVEERGTYEFQTDFIDYHLGVYATKPWLAGAIYWALEEFRVRPGWQGGNPRPHPPIHEKGLITFDGVRKPAWAEVQRLYRATVQLAP